MGCPTLKQKGNGVVLAQLCPCCPHPSVPLHVTPQPSQPPSLGPGKGGIAPLLRGRGCRRFAELRFFSQLPQHILPTAPTSAVHRRCSLGSRPRGLCLAGNSIQMELFFHIFKGGGEEGLGKKKKKKLPGPGKQREGEDLKGVWLTWEWRAWQGN